MYVQEIIDIKRRMMELEARHKELTYILLPEVQASGPIKFDGATVYFLDSRESKRLDKDVLIRVLTERLGEAVARIIIEQSSQISNATMPTVAVRLG
jgi:hypothetical protein